MKPAVGVCAIVWTLVGFAVLVQWMPDIGGMVTKCEYVTPGGAPSDGRVDLMMCRTYPGVIARWPSEKLIDEYGVQQ